MPLRLFGGQGSGKIRACPACERAIAADAMFCPSCYLVIRPEGAAELRKHLRGGRIPTDVYLLRKMQVEDPNAGPVVRVAGNVQSSPPTIEPRVPPPAAPPSSPAPAAQSPDIVSPSQPAPATSEASATKPTADTTGSPQGEVGTRHRGQAWTGVQSLLTFDPPLPPPTLSLDETPGLLAWMLERDPLIPNNTDLLETIHTGAFRSGPAAHLGYTQHVLLQIADDLMLHPTQETLSSHLVLLAEAYRRAAGAYHSASDKAQEETQPALWQMASMASRLRVEAWVYRTRHGVPPQITRPRRPRSQQVRGR